MSKERRDNGFTLAELLIVVAIIGILVAISIPIFSSQLEKAREATDAANIRSQYAEVVTDAIVTGGSINQNHSTYEPIQLKQQKDKWQNDGLKANLEGIFGSVVGDYPKAEGQAWVEYDASKDQSILHYGDGSGSSGGSGSGSSVSGESESGNGSGETQAPTEPATAPATDSSKSDSKPAESSAESTESSLEVKDPETQAPQQEISATDSTNLFIENAQLYPSGAFTGQLGYIYSYDNKLYVCTHAQAFENGGSPATWYTAQFTPLESTASILTSADIKKNSWGGSYMDLKCGDIYQDGDDYYISMMTGNWASAPDSSNIKSDANPNANVWVKIYLGK